MASTDTKPVVERRVRMLVVCKVPRMIGFILLGASSLLLWLWCIAAICYSGVDGVAVRAGFAAVFALL